MLLAATYQSMINQTKIIPSYVNRTGGAGAPPLGCCLTSSGFKRKYNCQRDTVDLGEQVLLFRLLPFYFSG